MDGMTALFLAVLGASLLGSAHCAGMCGAFVALSIAGTDGRDAWRGQVAYHAGRLSTYLALGVVAGFMGSVIDLGGSAMGVRRTAMLLAGAMLATFGLLHLARALGIRAPRLRPPRRWAAVVERIYARLMHLPVLPRAYLIGWATTLLPCGWLYAYVITAAGTGSALVGGMVMGAFWLGTLPALAAVGAGVRASSGRLGRRLPVLMPVMVIGLGGWTVAQAMQPTHHDPLDPGAGCGREIDLGANQPEPRHAP